MYKLVIILTTHAIRTIKALRARDTAGPLCFGDAPAFLPALCHACRALAVMRRRFSGDSFASFFAAMSWRVEPLRRSLPARRAASASAVAALCASPNATSRLRLFAAAPASGARCCARASARTRPFER